MFKREILAPREVPAVLASGRREGPFATAPVPAGLDWEMWLGPTPAVKLDLTPPKPLGNWEMGPEPLWFQQGGPDQNP